MMYEHLLTPQCFLFPALRKTKGTRIDTRIIGKEPTEVLWQRVGRVYDVQPIADDGQNKIGALCSYCWLGYKGVSWTAWHQWTDTQCPVPKTSMMGTDVADINQGVKPGSEYRVTNAKSSGHITFWKTWLQVLIENRHRAERRDFQRNPTGRQRITVFSLKRSDELFIATLELILDTGKCFSMLRLAGEKTGIAEPVATMSLRHDVGHLRANGYFYALDSGEHNAAQLTVELIKYFRLLKSAAWFENMVLPVSKKRIPIAAHAIVTDLMKPFFSIVFICNQQSTLLQDANLAGKCLNLLGVRYSVHRHIIKKAHPKRAVLREAG